jgi:hypothetical protein
LHFFDRNFEHGIGWYRSQLSQCADAEIVGEKTTEYLDTLNCDRTARRIAEILPDVKLIFVLREPVQRALSAVQHMVNSGLEAIPDDPEALLHEDARRPEGEGFRYLERGLYARQIEIFARHVAQERMLVLVLEDDVKAKPVETWRDVCDFLGIEPLPVDELDRPVNRLRLSRPAIHLSRMLYKVPFARGAIRRLDACLPFPAWTPRFPTGATQRIAPYFRDDVAALEAMLGRKLASWGKGDR